MPMRYYHLDSYKIQKRRKLKVLPRSKSKITGTKKYVPECACKNQIFYTFFFRKYCDAMDMKYVKYKNFPEWLF